MIATLTLNPSIDYVMKCPDVRFGETNRSEEERIYPGGKGINLSVMLRRLGIDSRCIAVKAGDTGELLEKLLRLQGLTPVMIPLRGNVFTRINVKLRGEAVTELNAKGPSMTSAAITSVCRELDRLQRGDILAAAGRFPEEEAAQALFSQLPRLKERGVKLAVDCSGPTLGRLLETGPFLAKPNREELEELAGGSLTDWESLSKAVCRFWRYGNPEKYGAEHILLSMGKEGAALFWDAENVWSLEAPQGNAVNTVGAGDSMLAGCLAAFLNGGSPREMLRMAVACGSGTAFSEWIAEKPLPMENLLPERKEWREKQIAGNTGV